MKEVLSDGTISWLGGMDTSRSAADIGKNQYSKGCNVIIPESLGGIRVRYGLHCAHLTFEDRATKDIYQDGQVQAEGYFTVNNKTYLVCSVDGYILKFTKTAANSFYVENVNSNSRNNSIVSDGWIITLPEGCIVNNGVDYPIYVTETGSRRLDISQEEIGIGKMGVYLQHRLFYVDQSGRRILASDFMQPTKFTREDTNIFGFMCPDSDEVITAIGKQKIVLGTVEGGNLIWSSNKDIYSADVRGTRTEWANLSTRLGKTTETVPGISAASSHSFESFNTNLHFRSKQYGMLDIKQSGYQFTNLDVVNDQAIEASYYLSNDTDWMLDKCYTKACNKRLYTTVSPERTDDGYIYWNGILSYNPTMIYTDQQSLPRRFESVFTGVRPWCLTVVQDSAHRDVMYIHSHDKDEVNRLYVMDEQSNFDVDHNGLVVEIEGFIETKAYTLEQPLLLKTSERRFYRMNLLDRTTKIKLFTRPEVQGEWMETWNTSHLIGRAKVEDGLFVPESHKGQTRPFVNIPTEKFSPCYRLGNKFIAIQYRIEFTGPINLDSLVVLGNVAEHEKTITAIETETITLVYNYRPDYAYSIIKT